MTKLIILNEKIDDNMEIAKSLKESDLLTTGVSETNKVKQKKTKKKKRRGEFFNILLGALGVSLLGNLLTGKVFKAEIPEGGVSTSFW